MSQYLYHPNGKLLGMERHNIFYYIATDPMGSALVIFNKDGSIMKKISYDPLGKLESDSNPGESGLIRGVAFGESGLIRGVAFGEIGLIRGVAFVESGLIRGVAFGESGLIRGVAFGESGLKRGMAFGEWLVKRGGLWCE
jgi:hypothetical protein